MMSGSHRRVSRRPHAASRASAESNRHVVIFFISFAERQHHGTLGDALGAASSGTVDVLVGCPFWSHCFHASHKHDPLNMVMTVKRIVDVTRSPSNENVTARCQTWVSRMALMMATTANATPMATVSLYRDAHTNHSTSGGSGIPSVRA
jgi:hypothetical protein